VKRDAIQLRKSPTFKRKITKLVDVENKIDKNVEKSVTKSAEKRKYQLSSTVEIKKKIKKSNIIKTITNEPEEFGSPVFKPTFLPRTVNRKIDSGFKQKKRVINFKVLAQSDAKSLKMPETNPFSADEQSDEHEVVAVVQSEVKVKIEDSDEESIATETSTNSAPKGPIVTSNGEIQSNSKEESKLKKILAKKAQERIASEKGLKAKIIKKLDEKFPEPPSPQKDLDNSFGPTLPPTLNKSEPSKNDLRRNLNAAKLAPSSSPVPTDSEGESEPEVQKEIIDTKEEEDTVEVEKRSNREVTVEAEESKKVLANFTITKNLETDKENNQIIKQKKSEKVLMEEKLKQLMEKTMSPYRAVKSADGRTQLHFMASKGDIYRLRTMLSSSDLILTDKKRTTVLHELAKGGFLFQVTPLIKPEMMVLKDVNGVTPLFECAKRSELIQLKTIAWLYIYSLYNTVPSMLVGVKRKIDNFETGFPALSRSRSQRSLGSTGLRLTP